MRDRKFVPDELFVKYWAKSRCISDMISYSGLSKNRIYIRARRLRKLGVSLPYFLGKADRVDVKKLNAIYEKCMRAGDS